MTRHAMWVGAVALAVALVAPTVSLAYFPPTIGQPPVTPPDPGRVAELAKQYNLESPAARLVEALMR